ncbi:MAG: HAD family hydrolase [Prevotella sp.]|nr:HAD family hydrolase [Prevotella sp.]
MNKHDVFLFDLDGTLLDTLDDLHLAVCHALKTAGMPERSREEVRQFVGNGIRMLMVRAVPGGEQNPRFKEAYDSFRQYYLEHSLDHTKPYDGILETLRELKRRGRRMAVVSNKMHEATVGLCRHFFSDTISVAIGENEARGIRKKPAPDTLQEALRQLGGTTAEALYVGDSDVDIETARNASVPCVSVLWGLRSRDFLLAHGAQRLIERPEELLDY